MAGHTKANLGRSQARHAPAGDTIFIGLTTAIFIGLSLMAAYSVWAAFR